MTDFLFPASLRLTAIAAAAVVHLAACAAEPASADAKPVPQAAVEVLNKLAGGPHPGFRANHAKGVLVTGSFAPAATAASLPLL